MNTNLLIAAARFFALARTAIWHGGMGGTINMAAGEISRATGASYEDAHAALDAVGVEFAGAEWHYAMYDAMDACGVEQGDERFCVRLVARAACRGVAAC